LASASSGGFRPGEDVLRAPPPGLAFTPAADAGGTDADVLMGYQIFLGRDPESSFVIADAKNSPVGAFIRALMGSGEFQSAVLDKLAAGRTLPHESAASAPRADQVEWLFRYIRTPARAESVLRALPGWADWLRTLAAVPGFPASPGRGGGAAVPDGVTPQAASDGFVLIQIEQPKAGEQLRPGGILHGSGWAIAPEDVAEIAIELDGTVLTHARYGLPRPDVARSYPHYRHVDHCGFSFSADLPADLPAAGAGGLTVKLRTLTGQTGQKSVRLARPEAAASEPGASAEAAWPIRLSVEEAVVDSERKLRLRGWAVSAGTMREIAVALGDTMLGAATTGLPRPDIAASHGSYPNAAQSGFAFVHDVGPEVPAGPGFVRVQALDEAGNKRQAIVPVVVPDQPARLPRADPDEILALSCDRAVLTTDGALTVSGWAVAASGVPTIRVDLDGITLGEFLPSRPRPDVAARFPDLVQSGSAGFFFAHQLPRRPKKGVHTLSVLASDAAGNRRETQLPVVAEAPAARPAQTEIEPPSAAQAVVAPLPEASRNPAGLRLEVDRPALDGGRAREPVRGALTIAGWAAGRYGLADVSVFCDAMRLGHAHCGMRREDIGAAFPEYKGSLLAGYALVLPPGALPEGTHTIRIVAAGTGADGKPGPERECRFDVVVERYDALPPGGDICLDVPPARAQLGLNLLAERGLRPVFSVLIDAAAASAETIETTVASLHAQVYGQWTAAIHLPDRAALEACAHLQSARVTLHAPARVSGRKQKAATAVKQAAGFVLKLRPGDRLGADALLELALASAREPHSSFLYADELRFDPAQRRPQPFFKPTWSPELALSMNYVGRPWCAATTLLTAAELTQPALAGLSDYEAVLRLTERAAPGEIAHIPRVLCARGDLTDSAGQEQDALRGALARRAVAGDVEPGAAPGTWRVRRHKMAKGQARRLRGTVANRVSIIMPTRAAGDLVRTAIKTIRATTAGADVEIVLLDNTPVSETRTRAWLRRNADVVVDMPGAFNWSRFNNVGAQAATGEFLLFLNDDIEARAPGWLEAMLEQARRPDVGVVGARLLYPDGKVQHGGQYLADTHARHAFRFADPATPGPFGLAQVTREMISVTGACQLMRARTFAALGGFEEAHSVVNNDLDFCLRAWAAGLAVIYTPHATLVHHELASRAALQDSYDEARFRGAWHSRFLRGDPFRSPRLALDADHYGVNAEPAVLLHAGRRGPPADAVRRILAVKLDHIGDFLTALPALRSLARRFPRAQIDLLAPAATAELARREPFIAETIVFDFFHARSGEGQKGVGETEFRALSERLAPARYDIAIDLRMQPETRAVLPWTGARFLAGYDRDNRFTFLDVALEWEGDARLVPKRAHVSERLVQLVSATEDACRSEAGPLPAGKLDPGAVPALASLPPAFLARPLVCIHPGVGNPVRQWPASHYASLIDLLDEEGLHAVLIGGPDEAGVAEDVLRRVARPGCAESLVGRVRLSQLADVMRACVLFVGNNSGPKHLAASLGMPVVGVHSGVVDAVEWAPLGARAVAIRRQMICGPCYLEFASDCPRSLACLTGLRPLDVLAACKEAVLF